jgi:hypothetical protein
VAAALALALFGGGCEQEAYECGRGTFEERGVCVPAMRIEPRCGEGTAREGDQCVSVAAPPLTCGPGAEAIDEGDYQSCECNPFAIGECPAREAR